MVLTFSHNAIKLTRREPAALEQQACFYFWQFLNTIYCFALLNSTQSIYQSELYCSVAVGVLKLFCTKPDDQQVHYRGEEEGENTEQVAEWACLSSATALHFLIWCQTSPGAQDDSLTWAIYTALDTVWICLCLYLYLYPKQCSWRLCICWYNVLYCFLKCCNCVYVS